MPVIEYQDFILSKNAYYFDEGSVQQSGCLVVTKKTIMLNVIQTVNLPSDYDGDLTSLKESTRQIKKDFKAIGEYGKRKKEILYIAQNSDSVEDFEKKVISRGALNAKSINILWDDVESYTVGLFFGLKLKLKNGATRDIKTMRLGKIKKFLKT